MQSFGSDFERQYKNRFGNKLDIAARAGGEGAEGQCSVPMKSDVSTYRYFSNAGLNSE